MRWDFCVQENGDRIERLRTAPSLESILGALQQRPILCCHEDAIRGTPIKRVAYSIDAGEELFDLFFNSLEWGPYFFYRDPFEGLKSNRLCLDILESTLLNERADLSNEIVRESLRTGSAKIWLAEHGKQTLQGCVGCEGEWRAQDALPEILNDRWELSDYYKATWGRQAPHLTKLRVFGAFLDEQGNEFIPNEKRFRAQEISAFGWS